MNTTDELIGQLKDALTFHTVGYTDMGADEWSHQLYFGAIDSTTGDHLDRCGIDLDNESPLWWVDFGGGEQSEISTLEITTPINEVAEWITTRAQLYGSYLHYKTNTRRAGALVKTLDPDTLLTIGQQVFEQQYPGADQLELRNTYLPQMIFAVDRGCPAIVNAEGVGSIANDKDEITVYFAYGYNVLPLTLTLDQLNDAITLEHIDLAVGIRTHGQRLDDNHAEWFARYDKHNS